MRMNIGTTQKRIHFLLETNYDAEPTATMKTVACLYFSPAHNVEKNLTLVIMG